MKQTIVIASGFFNPIHMGHIDMFQKASCRGNMLWVIVNNDLQVKLKGSTPFFNEVERLQIVNSIRWVGQASLSIDQDITVVKSIKQVYKSYKRGEVKGCGIEYSFIFANGGDVGEETAVSPEVELCKNLGIELVYNIGGGKIQSSSELIRKAAGWTA